MSLPYNSDTPCDRCGDEYETYSVFITDNPKAIRAFKRLNDDGYEDLCKPCRMYFVEERDIPGHAFTTENEEIEPKYEIE